MSNLARATARPRDQLSQRECADPAGQEIQAALKHLKQVVDETGALLQLVTAITEQTYEPALRFCRAVRSDRPTPPQSSLRQASTAEGYVGSVLQTPAS